MNSLILAIALSSPSAEPTFVVTNKCDTVNGFTVTNKCPTIERRVVQPVTLKAPVGHTHTCPNGHTWDHSTNPTHTCQICGLSQFIQDSTPRMVTSTQKQYSLSESTYSSSGCAGGNCPTATSSSRGNWYPGKLLGR